MTHAVIVSLAVLAVVGQIAALLFVVLVLADGLGLPGPLRVLRAALSGYELWGAFAVSSIATGGSLYFSEVAGFIPCELCWYQRICMYPLSIITLLAALSGAYGIARYLLPLPIVGACISVYHLLVENGVVGQTNECLASAPGGCATKWINEFGYVTIPTLALTAFLLLVELLGLAAAGGEEPEAADAGA